MLNKKYPRYEIEKIKMSDGGWWVSIFCTRSGDIVFQPIRASGETLEKALENAKNEFNVYLEREYRMGKTFIDELNKQISEAIMGIE